MTLKCWKNLRVNSQPIPNEACNGEADALLARLTPARQCSASTPNMEELTSGEFYWAALDVDFDIDTIEHPKRFPLPEFKDGGMD